MVSLGLQKSHLDGRESHAIKTICVDKTFLQTYIYL